MSAPNAFQTSLDIPLPVGTGGQNVFFQVPLGKRLVIEYASGEAFLPAGQSCLFSVITFLGSQRTGTTHLLNLIPVGKNGNQERFRTAQIVSLYADQGTFVTLRVERTLAQGVGQATMAVSGQLFDVP